MTKAEKAHKAKLAQMCCAICERLHGPHDGGYVELHHLRKGGWGKGDYTTLIPLCANHHRGQEGIHQMGTKAWEKHFSVSQESLLKTIRGRL